MPKPLLALTIKQPWAQLIMRAGKDIENRDWSTRIRGRVAIHASARMTKSDLADACHFMHAWMPKFSERIFTAEAATYATGAILGTVEIVDCVTTSDSPWFCGRYGFVLRDPIVLPNPIPFKGALGFWAVPESVAKSIKRGEVPYADR